MNENIKVETIKYSDGLDPDLSFTQLINKLTEITDRSDLIIEKLKNYKRRWKIIVLSDEENIVNT